MAHTKGPFRVEGSIYEHMAAEIVAAEPGNERGIAQVWKHENAMSDAALFGAAPELLTAAKNAAATIGAVYQWLEMVENAGGATSISGIAKCNAMLKSLRSNADRTEKLVMEPLRAAIKKAEG